MSEIDKYCVGENKNRERVDVRDRERKRNK